MEQAEPLNGDGTINPEWWELHRRFSVGEVLPEDQRRIYEEGLSRLHAAETIEGDVDTLLQLRKRVAEQEADLARLRSRIEELKRDILVEEARLDEPTRRRLGIEAATAR
jgi:Fic family protein